MTAALAPVIKTRTLACSAEHAFAVFTADIGQWWPTDTHAINDDVVDVVLDTQVGGSIREVASDGTETVWGRILEVDPPHVIRFSWHLQRPEPSEVRVAFTDVDGGCRLELVHSGWEAWGEDGPSRRAQYDGGWEVVLDLCQSSAIASSSSASSTS